MRLRPFLCPIQQATSSDISGQSFTASGLRDSQPSQPACNPVRWAGSGRMEPIIKNRAEATRDQAAVRAQQSPWNVRGRLQGGLAEVATEAGIALPWNEKQLCLRFGMWSNWFGIKAAGKTDFFIMWMKV